MPNDPNGATAEGMPADNLPAGALRSDPETVVTNLARLLDLANALALDGMQRIVSEDGHSYTMRGQEADQLMALLFVTRDYAEHEIGEGRR